MEKSWPEFVVPFHVLEPDYAAGFAVVRALHFMDGLPDAPVDFAVAGHAQGDHVGGFVTATNCFGQKMVLVEVFGCPAGYAEFCFHASIITGNLVHVKCF